jgi:phospholipase/lecithinase/hemolysin
VIYYVYQIQSAQIPYDTIVCFGDSASDTGNVYNLTGSKWPIDPPYYHGRFSNGPVWIEKFGTSGLINYAYGSATTDNILVTGVTASNTIVPGVRQQIAMYKNATNINKINFIRTLYVIWIGVNDYFFNMYLVPSVVVNSLMNGINDLIQIGGKNFLIINQPPFQAYPISSIINMNSYLTTLTFLHNGNLSKSIQSLQSNFSNISLHFYDVYSVIVNILNNASVYGFNSTTNCWNTLNSPINISCTTPDTYIFIDEYHFTTRIHQLIADNALEVFINSNETMKSSQSIVFLFSFFISLYTF